jgi:hypothetical protein
LGYLDKNLESFEDAVKETAANAYKEAAEMAKSEKETRAALDKAATSGGIKATLGPGEPAFGEVMNRVNEELARRKSLKEQTSFETFLYQVNLILKVDRDVGGGIVHKLNRIRAIQGVTVVGHEDYEGTPGVDTIEAKIKFHPESDAMRPGTYVTRILIPAIDLSNRVPGISVVKAVRGTLKRLDK